MAYNAELKCMMTKFDDKTRELKAYPNNFFKQNYNEIALGIRNTEEVLKIADAYDFNEMMLSNKTAGDIKKNSINRETVSGLIHRLENEKKFVKNAVELEKIQKMIDTLKIEKDRDINGIEK